MWMIRSGECLHPKAQTAGLFENWEVYRSNTILANIGWGGSQKAFHAASSPIRGKVSHAQLPHAAQVGGYFNWGWSYVMPKGGSMHELAFLFCALAVSPRISTRAVEQAGGYFDPFHDVHYAAEGVRAVYGNSFLTQHEIAMRNARPDLILPGYTNYLSSLNEHLFLALNGTTTIEASLRRLQIEWENVTFELGRNAQIRHLLNAQAL